MCPHPLSQRGQMDCAPGMGYTREGVHCAGGAPGMELQERKVSGIECLGKGML